MSIASPKVTVIDYGMGNIRSIESAIQFLGYECCVSADPREIARSEILVLPGVGAFPSAMKVIKEREIDQAIRETIEKGKSKILGICLGMQLLTESSTEDGGSPGLGIIEEHVDRFPSEVATSLPIPHVGFNSVLAPQGSVLFNRLTPKADFYFVHSYRVKNVSSETVQATCNYGEDFVAAFECGNVFGTQFHPEKSQSNGLHLLSNFLESELK